MDVSFQSLIEAALQQGIWAALYIYLSLIHISGMAAYDERLPDGVNDILSGRTWDGYQVTEVDTDTPVSYTHLPVCEIQKAGRIPVQIREKDSAAFFDMP